MSYPQINPQVKKWYIDNLRLLNKKNLGQVFYDEMDFSWIILSKFPLPEIFNKRFSALFIDTPQNNIEDFSAYMFYMDNELIRNDGKECNHLIDVANQNRHLHGEWTMLSLHLESFNPSFTNGKGDTYLDICQAIYNFLGKDWDKY